MYNAKSLSLSTVVLSDRDGMVLSIIQYIIPYLVIGMAMVLSIIQYIIPYLVIGMAMVLSIIQYKFHFQYV